MNRQNPQIRPPPTIDQVTKQPSPLNGIQLSPPKLETTGAGASSPRLLSFPYVFATARRPVPCRPSPVLAPDIVTQLPPPFSVFAAARRQLPSSRHPSLILLPPNTSGSHRPSPVLAPDIVTQLPPPFSVFAAARRQLPSSRHPSLILLPPNTSGSHRPSPVLPSPEDTTPSSVTLLRSATAKHHRLAPAAIFVPHPLRHSLLSLPRSAPTSYFARFITDPEPDIHRFLRSATGHHSGRRSRRLLPDHQSPQGRPPPNLDKIAKQPLPKTKTTGAGALSPRLPPFLSCLMLSPAAFGHFPRRASSLHHQISMSQPQ